MHIIKKSKSQIDMIRTSGQYLTELQHLIYGQCEIGKTLRELEQIAIDYIAKHKLVNAFHNYGWFPWHICTSLNDCVVHGVPDRTILRPGDLLKVDIGINYRGAISDAAFSIVIWWGDKNPEGQTLIEGTKWALDAGLEFVRSGTLLAAYSTAVADHLHDRNLSVIKNLTGHGVGIKVHEDPHIYNYPHPSMYKTKFQTGMVVALEPITAQTSTSYIEDKTNGRNLYTKNGDLWAQREYTVAVTDNGPEILAGIEKL